MDPSEAPWRTLDAADPVPAEHPHARRAPFRWPVVGAVVAAAGLSMIAFALVVSGPHPVAVVGADVAAVADVTAGTSPTPSPRAEIVVHVAGAVRRPGLVRLAPGARVADAIEGAGGLGPRVDTTRVDRELNLAAPVADGDHIVVPSRDDATSGGGPAASSGASPGRVDLNHAGADALDALPGIGPATVAKIVAARQERPFRTLDELVARKVLGQATLEKIRDLVELR